jgi:uracil-DNA glycosylase family 4
MIKQYLVCNCNNKECPHYNDPCCKLCTELILHNEDKPIDLMFIGMGAGKDEDINLNPKNIHNQPFVGRAGKYLRDVIKYLWDNHKLFNIALSNTVRCHPIDNNNKDREPTQEELNYCLHHIKEEIEQLKPKSVILLGMSSFKSFIKLDNDDNRNTIKVLRKFQFYNKDIGYQTTYHPSFLCRTYGKFNNLKPNFYDSLFIENIKNALLESNYK